MRVRQGTLGRKGFDPPVQLLAHLAERGHARLDAVVPPPPPGRRVDLGGGQDFTDLDAMGVGIDFEFEDFGGHLLHGGDTVQECTTRQCRNATGGPRALVHNCAMAEIADEARAFLSRALQVSGLKPHALAKRAGVAPTTITRPLNDPAFKFTPKPATLRKIAEAAGLDLPDALAIGPALTPVPGQLPLFGPVQAGAFLLVDDSDQDDPPTVPVLLDPRYPHAPQWLREVRGDSMNARGVFPGDLAHIVDFAAAGINLNTGMVVEVTRTRDGGGLREITLKEVELTPEGVVLWPRSTNPRWKDPVRLDDDTGSDIEVQITGLLLAKITRF